MCLTLSESHLLQGWTITCRLNPWIRIKAIRLEVLQLSHQLSTSADREVRWVEIAILLFLIPIHFKTLSRDPWPQAAQAFKQSSQRLCSKSWTSMDESWLMEGMVPSPTTLMGGREAGLLKSPITFRTLSSLSFAHSSISPKMISARFNVTSRVRSSRRFASTLNSPKRNPRLPCDWTHFSNVLTSLRMKSLRGLKRWFVATIK